MEPPVNCMQGPNRILHWRSPNAKPSLREADCSHSVCLTMGYTAPPGRRDRGILGVVTDPTGSAVPGATVTLRNADTGLNRTATTDTTGGYEFLVVPAGDNYVLEVEARGFRKSSQSGLKVLVNQRFRADFQLVVGSVTQAINVTAEAAQVETTSTQIGDVIEDKKMSTLPLNGRSYIDLLGLQAGVVPLTSD